MSSNAAASPAAAVGSRRARGRGARGTSTPVGARGQPVKSRGVGKRPTASFAPQPSDHRSPARWDGLSPATRIRPKTATIRHPKVCIPEPVTVPTNLLKQARQTGQLNLAARNLTSVPESVWRLNIDPPEDSQHIPSTLQSPPGSSSEPTTGAEPWWQQALLTKLVLANNLLSGELSTDVGLLETLTVLDVHDNQLSSLPTEIGRLKKLNKLVCSHNKLEKLPNELSKLTELKVLHAAHNCLTDLDDDLGNLCYLESLDLSHNQLKKLPKTVGFLTRVRTFNVSNNLLRQLPHEIAAMAALTSLDASDNELKMLPEMVGQLHNLEVLELRKNNLVTLPLLTSCHALKELHVGDNDVRGVSAEQVEHMVGLKILDLHSNKIAEIPDEIVLMTALERLDLSNNSLSDLPYQMGTLTHLKSLQLEGNSLKKIRRDIIKRGTVALLKWLRERIAVPPDGENGENQDGGGDVLGFQQLQRHYVNTTKTLDLSNKSITSGISEEVWNSAVKGQVENVNLSKNRLTDTPSQIVQLSETLVDLNLSFNRIGKLLPELASCKHLRFLNVGSNTLSDLPSALESLGNLQEINISSNSFPRIPEVVYKMAAVETVIAADNKIDELDVEKLAALPKLSTLDVQNNNIAVVPPLLGNFTKLRSLQIGGNAFRVPRPATLAKGTNAILEYLRTRIPQS